ncbi:Trichodiene synthase [Penicillium rubens]|uniref:Trichodiene synthase n=1 Tax=Penicillium rubens TaxID=1108849 RepID=UPI002A5A5CC7|nr:Trichodiene synthase [Penicillium rubens]KAJ5831529.1 Trichodiene synthase [Penicillium rubens]
MDNVNDNSPFIEHFIDTIVKFLDDVQYNEPHHSLAPEPRANFESIYEESLRFFTQPTIQEQLSLRYDVITKATRTTSRLTLYCWPNIPRKVMAQIAIHFTELHIMDDSPKDYHADMATFFSDLLDGNEQKVPYWPREFNGYRGSDRYPTELRRLGQLGACMGSFIFPRTMSDEAGQFEDITSAIVHTEPVGALVNDLFSFYKEGVVADVYGTAERNNLVMNVCHVKGLSIKEGFDEIAADAIRAVHKAQEVFDGSHSVVAEDGIHAFIRGYIRWHFCDQRYRMGELYDASYRFENGRRFREYCDMAWNAGGVSMDQPMFEAVEKRVSTRRQSKGSLLGSIFGRVWGWFGLSLH